MFSFILRRLFALIPLLLGISLLVFLLMYLAPGDFLNEARNSKDISPEIVRQQELALGLDKPWYMQYGMWLNSVSPLKTSLLLPDAEKPKHTLLYFGAPDFGYSWSYKISVTSLISQRLAATLVLALCSAILTYLIAVPLGVMAAVKKGSLFDKAASLLSYAALSVPYFFLALLAVIFAATTGIFPTGGQVSIMHDFLPPLRQFTDYAWHLVLPTLVLSAGGIASVMRVMRGNFLDYQKAEFATTARAKGLSEGVIMFKHVLRNAINPIITSFGFAFSGLLSGALLVENVMNYPGLGQLIYQAIIKQDQYVVMAGVVMGCVMLVAGQLLADVLLALADPRIRLDNPKIPARPILLLLGGALAVTAFFTWLAESHAETFARTAAWLLFAGKILFAIMIAGVALGLLLAAVFFVKNLLGPALKRRAGAAAFGALMLLYLCALFAPFLAPYEQSAACLEKSFHPPTALAFKDGALKARVYENADPSMAKYVPIDGEYLDLEFFARGPEYRLFGLIPCSVKLFGIKGADPSARVYLLGSDSTGRDVFSRLLYGAQVSLSIGFIGIAITMGMGFLIGGLSGYFGGSFDFMAMRLVEFLMAVPGLYLLLAMRSALAPYFDSARMYLMIVIILSVLGWAGTARVIRGMSLSLANRQFVQAAESMGQPPLKIIVKHFLPNVLSYLIVSATLAIPGYILGEAALSFLGLGIQEPSSSWGLMLAQAQSDNKVLMLGFWWMLLPGLAIFVTVLAFNLLGDVLRDIADPKRTG